MDKILKVIITILIILVIAITIYVGKLIIDNNKINAEENNTIQPKNESTSENKIDNEIENNIDIKENESKNEIEENTIEKNDVVSNVVGKEESESKEDNTKLSDDDKAIKLVKDKFAKNDSTIKFIIAPKLHNRLPLCKKEECARSRQGLLSAFVLNLLNTNIPLAWWRQMT